MNGAPHPPVAKAAQINLYRKFAPIPYFVSGRPT